MRLKKTVTLLLSVFLVAFLWFLFFKPYHYVVTFTRDAYKGELYTHIKSFIRSQEVLHHGFKSNIENVFYESTYKDSDKKYQVHWTVNSKSDSLSTIRIGLIDKVNPIKTKWALLFGASGLKELTSNLARAFNKYVEEAKKKYSFETKGKTVISMPFCMCISSSRLLVDKKAGEMIRLNDWVLSFIRNHNLRLSKRRPILTVTEWDRSLDSISFDFCFPIEKQDKMPNIMNQALMHYKQEQTLEAFQIDFYGNYAISNIVWEVAQNIEGNETINFIDNPTEFYFDNPHSGGDSSKWKASIYIPIGK